jgi:hypothetical protein
MPTVMRAAPLFEDNHGGGGGGDSNGGDDHGGNRGRNGDNNDNNNNQANQNENNNQAERTDVRLAPTTAGAALRAEGNVDVRAQGTDQRLKVEAEANAGDGTILNVIANGTLVGTITIRLHEGEFEFETRNGGMLPGGLVPVATTSIVVTDLNNIALLQAQFAALTANLPPATPGGTVTQNQKSFTATPAGTAVRAEGFVDLRSQGNEQRLKVEVEARVADGTSWTLVANDGIVIGAFIFHFQESEIQLESDNGMLPPGLVSLSAITSLQVKDAANNIVLTVVLQ